MGTHFGGSSGKRDPFFGNQTLLRRGRFFPSYFEALEQRWLLSAALPNSVLSDGALADTLKGAPALTVNSAALGGLSARAGDAGNVQGTLRYVVRPAAQWAAGVQPGTNYASPFGYTAAQIRKGYGFGDLTDAGFTNRGDGQTVAVVLWGDTPTIMADLTQYSADMGLPAPTPSSLQVVYASGTQPTLASQDAMIEADGDVEAIHAIAPNARIVLVEAASSANSDVFGAVDTAVQILTGAGGGVVNMSFGESESYVGTSLESHFTGAGAGVSFVAATGDSAGMLSYPAMSPEVTAVGGTTLALDASGNRVSESAWSLGGGGTSAYFSRPDYQNGVTINGSLIGSMRATPDVALASDPGTASAPTGMALYHSWTDSYGSTGYDFDFGGTSMASPLLSGSVALANQQRLAGGMGPIGSNLNAALYSIAAGNGGSAFNDITSGSNSHQAYAGYDLATGWGSPKASALIHLLGSGPASDPALTAGVLTPPAATEGVAFSNAVLFHFTDADPNGAAAQYTATIGWGDGTLSTVSSTASANGQIVANAGGGFDVLGSHTYAEESTNKTFSVQVVDAGWAPAIVASTGTFSVADAALTAGAYTPPAAVAGQAFSNAVLFHFADADPAGTASDYSATIFWGDGTNATLTSTPSVDGQIVADNGGFDVQGSHSFAATHSGANMSIEVSDKGGAPAISAGVVDPVLTAGSLTPPVTVEGQAFSNAVLFHFTDEDANGAPSDYTATITWGDGTSSTVSSAASANGQIVANVNGGFDVQGSHTYAEELTGGTFGVQVTDMGGGASTDAGVANFSVADAALTGGALTPPQAFVQEPFSSAVLFHFTDGDPGGTASDYTATITWGDGTTSTVTGLASGNGQIVAGGSGFDVLGSHMYAAAVSNQTFRVQVGDSGGAAPVSSSVDNFSVAASAVRVQPAAVSATEGAPVHGVLVATFRDANSNAAPYTATINWGDGDTTASYTIAPDANVAGQFDVLASKTRGYAEEGIATTLVTVHDSLGAVGSDAATGLAWSSAAGMPTARGFVSAAMGMDGRIYVFGGSANNQSVNTVEALSPSSNSWTSVHGMPTATSKSSAATGADGRIYIFGGQNGAGYLSTVQAYTPATDTWTTVSPMPTARAASSAVAAPDGRIYVLGGHNAGGDISVVEAYNPASDSWTTVASLLQPIGYASATLGGDGRIYLFGGSSNGVGYQKWVEAYTPATNRWVTVANLPVQLIDTSAAAGPDGRLYVFGGSGGTFTSAVEAYSIGSNSWSSIASMPTVRYATAAATAADGRIYVFGGFNASGGALNTVEALTPAGVANIADAALAAGAFTPPQAVLGQALSNAVLFHFTDADPAGDASDYSASVVWGDGASSTLTSTPSPDGQIVASNDGFDVQGTHSYAAQQSDQGLSIQVRDVGGAPAIGPSWLPTVVTPASATPSPVAGKTATLSVLGTEAGGESNLTYTWATTGTPPAAVAFSSNNTNAAKNTTATFSKAGVYGFMVTIKDAGGLTATSGVSVTVNSTLTTIAVSPGAASLHENGSQQFAATAADQFGVALATQPTFVWAVGSGVGSITSSGLYTAGAATGAASITASSGPVAGSATVTVTNAVPTVATAAWASPSPVNGVLTNLSVLGADDGGESNLTYTWATTGTPPAAVAFSTNNTNAAKNTTATFSKAGVYGFVVTIKDAGGLTTTSSVGVMVNPTLTSIVVSPSNGPTVLAGNTQQFTASGADQFGQGMTAAVNWSTNGVGNTISSAGLFTAGITSGTYTVTAANGTARKSVQVVVNGTIFTGQADIGSVGVAGSYGLANGVYTVKGSGADIWGKADAFHYVYMVLGGDEQIVARVTAVGNTDAWAKGGVMIRETLAAGAREACVAVTPSNGVAFQWRGNSGGPSDEVTASGLGAPCWIKLVRSGNGFSAYQSADGAAWTQVGATQSITMAPTVYVGLAVTAHNNAALCSVTFDNVAVTPYANLALGKAVVASSTATGSAGANVVDGNVTTAWTSAAGGTQTVTVDLGSVYAISHVSLIWGSAYAKAYSIQLSSDNATWTSVYSATAGTGGTVDVTSLRSSARYVRLIITAGKSSIYMLDELQVFGA
jgi:hypothetical protein